MCRCQLSLRSPLTSPLRSPLTLPLLFQTLERSYLLKINGKGK